jgi:hypothetical protein
MQDSALLAVAGVGLALVCVGLVVLGFIMLLRLAGSARALFSGGDDEHRRIVRASEKTDLRAIADAQDFDSALARHAGRDEIEPHATQRLNPSADAPAGFDASRTTLLGSRRPKRPELRRDDEDADLFGGLLEDDQIE